MYHKSLCRELRVNEKIKNEHTVVATIMIGRMMSYMGGAYLSSLIASP